MNIYAEDIETGEPMFHAPVITQGKLNWTKPIYYGHTLNYWFCRFMMAGDTTSAIVSKFKMLNGRPENYLKRTCNMKYKNHLHLENGTPGFGSHTGTAYRDEYLRQGGVLARDL
jgi:hypothetical protein